MSVSPKSGPTLSAADTRLLAAAAAARKNGYAPYSCFLVGAAALDLAGHVHVGANFENASYGVSVCAEVNALGAAIVAGQLRNLKAIAVVGGPEHHAIAETVTPCGRCRQLIAEAAELSGVDLPIICANGDLSMVALYRISELLPHAFGRSQLGQSGPGVSTSRVARLRR